MKRLGIPLASTMAALLLAAPSAAFAVTPVRESVADAIVLKPLSLLKKKNMDFGTLITSATAGTATIDPATGAVITTGGVTAATGTTSAATFVGAGSKNVPFQIRLPTAPITLTRSGGTETMTVGTWTTDGPLTRRVASNEAFQFGIGARLTVAANQAPGTYVGTFNVTVHYP
jgi:hypothetical protein